MIKQKHITTIKENLEAGGLDLPDDELEAIKDLRKNAILDEIGLARLYVQCYNFIEMNSIQIDERGILDNFLKGFDICEIREKTLAYKNGLEYGDHIIEANIKSLVNKNREKYNELIKIFFQIFGVED